MKPLSEFWKASRFFFFFNSSFITAEASATIQMDAVKLKKKKKTPLKMENNLVHFRKIIKQEV